MMPVGVVYAYYDNPSMLKIQLHNWLSYPVDLRNRIHFTVVDDGSPNAPAITVAREILGAYWYLRLEIYRVMVDKPWGQDGARNIAMKHATCGWNLMSDIDHMLTWSNAAHMLSFVDQSVERGCYYMPGRCLVSGSPYHSHPNTFLMHRDDFWDMGGYDEDFVGWYGSDGNFRKCAKGAGLHEVVCSDSFKMTLYSSGDCVDANTRAFGRKDSPLWAVHNPALNAKRMGPAYRAVNPHRLPYVRVA